MTPAVLVKGFYAGNVLEHVHVLVGFKLELRTHVHECSMLFYLDFHHDQYRERREQIDSGKVVSDETL